jgi:peroxiredoxin
LRQHHEEIKEQGAEIVAIGTGDTRYARAFIDDEEIDFPVLLDDDGEAAEIASLRNGRWYELAGPKIAAGVLKATAAGKRQHRLGKRPKQLGATFVIGPGDVIRYEHMDGDVSDHAPFEEIMAALNEGNA